MNIKEAYDNWSAQYDGNINRTRDLEAIALRETLTDIHFDNCLEIGCGTGKNTSWLIERSKRITAVDLSGEMLAKAKAKIISEKVNFIQADILQEWKFATQKYDLITFSLILEHIENLQPVFENVSNTLAAGGFVYIGELHPFKQYAGSKARFTTPKGEQIVTCFNHHISDFTSCAKKYNLNIVKIDEHFDEGDRTDKPRILTLLLKGIVSE